MSWIPDFCTTSSSICGDQSLHHTISPVTDAIQNFQLWSLCNASLFSPMHGCSCRTSHIISKQSQPFALQTCFSAMSAFEPEFRVHYSSHSFVFAPRQSQITHYRHQWRKAESRSLRGRGSSSADIRFFRSFTQVYFSSFMLLILFSSLLSNIFLRNVAIMSKTWRKWQSTSHNARSYFSSFTDWNASKVAHWVSFIFSLLLFFSYYILRIVNLL